MKKGRLEFLFRMHSQQRVGKIQFSSPQLIWKPIHRLQPKFAIFSSANVQTSNNKQQVAINATTTPNKQQQPLIRNGSPLSAAATIEKPNATIAGANRLSTIQQPIQSSTTYSQQKQQPIAQKTLSSTLIGNKTPVSSTTFGTVPAPNLSTSTFNAVPIPQVKQLQPNRSPHSLPHQTITTPHQRLLATKPQQLRQPNIAGRLANCPQFHYPTGRPVPRAENDNVREKVRQLFNTNASNPQQLEYKEMGKLCEAIGLAVYSKRAVYDACLHLSAISLDPTSTSPPPLTFNQFNTYWQLMTSDCHDEGIF